MTPQEQQMIDGLINRIRSTEVANKDTAAEQRLQQGLAGYPDALYVLAQTVLVQQYGLQQAGAQLEALKQQNTALQEQVQQAQQAGTHIGAGSGGFLSHIFGNAAGSGTQNSSQMVQPPAPPPSYQPVNNPGYGSQSYPAPGYPPPPPPQSYPAPGGGGMLGSGGMLGGGGGGFLQGAMQTAAGVAAGEMMFQGMESLFHGFEHSGGGYERGLAGSGGGETVNNYYDDNGGDRGERHDRRDDSSFYNPSDDASRDAFAGSDNSTDSNFGDTGGENFSGSDLGSDDGGSNDFSGGSDSGF